MGIRVAPADDPRWRYLALPGRGGGGDWAGFALAHLEPGAALDLPVTDLEAVVVPLRGAVAVDGAWGALALAGRSDVWDAPGDLAYLPPARAGGPVTRLRAGSAAVDVAVGLAPAGGGPAGPVHVRASAVATERRGAGVTEREVRHLYEADRPAGHLLVVEVLTPPGHWSSFPPHRHDEPRALEEFYYCEVQPTGRLAYLHVFDDPVADGRPAGGHPVDEAVAARHGDLVLVRRGYHTAACPPGSTLYYLNVMAGPDRSWSPTFHPAYRDLVVGWERAPLARG